MVRTIKSNLHHTLFSCLLCIGSLFAGAAYCQADEISQIKPETFKFMRVTSGDVTCSSYVKAANIAFSTKKYDMGISMLLQYENAACQVEISDGQIYYNLGVLYENGFRVERSIDKAIVYYKQAADKSNINALYLLGYLYMNEDEIKNYHEASKWFELAAAKGDVSSMVFLGMLYFEELYGMVDYEKAYDCFASAAKREDAWALFYLGLFHYEGIGNRYDEARAIEYFDKSASLGDEDAAIYLSWIYFHSNSKKSISKSYFWLRIAMYLGFGDEDEIAHMVSVLGAEMTESERQSIDIQAEEKIKQIRR